MGYKDCSFVKWDFLNAKRDFLNTAESLKEDFLNTPDFHLGPTVRRVPFDVFRQEC